MTLVGQAQYHGRVDSLDIYFMFLDDTGRVINKKLVYSSGFRFMSSRTNERLFNETLPVPAGAMGISFNYSAQLRNSRH